MSALPYKTTLTWANDGDRRGQGNSAFQQAGYNYLQSVISDPDRLLPKSIVMDGTDVGNTTADMSKDIGPVVVTRLWETQQQAQDFVDFMNNLCTEYNVPIISAVVEPNT